MPDKQPTLHPPGRRRGLELKIPPLLLVFLAAALMWLISKKLPEFQFALPARRFLSAAFAIAGATIAALGVISFRRARTTVNPMKPGSATSLVVSGIYTVSRNPMYVGFLLLLVGCAILLSNLIAVVVVPLFILYMNRFQIRPEEQVLASLFGQQFAEYRLRVRRWF